MNPYEETNVGEFACKACGEVAIVAIRMQGMTYEVPLCGDCLDHAVTACPECEQTFWERDGGRIYKSGSKHCPRCYAKHPAIVGATMAGILADEQQDAFNRTRR